jgi:hypothetical protein
MIPRKQAKVVFHGIPIIPQINHNRLDAARICIEIYRAGTDSDTFGDS